MSSRRQKQQEPGVPKELVKDFDVTLYLDGKIVAQHSKRGNYQRLQRISFDNVPLCDAISIHVLSTNGISQARIFEVRAYSTPFI
jgi:hypothetical protein